ncbi:MAG: hypothetical protein LBC75_04005 [Fibromonadaceae bacterium]|jgi:hypothetical protein|nr:hypothetical protein [Fibromonadaceae bacterium]
MRVFSKILPTMALLAFLAQIAFAEGIYDRDLVRGFLGFKGDFRSQKSNGVKLINEITRKSYVKEYACGHVEIGGEYNKMRTWMDIDFMPLTPVRGTTEWYTYGITWMWGYKLRAQNARFNIIPSIGPSIALLNIRKDPTEEVMSSFGPAFNMELEFRLQFSQFSAGLYGGYKVERHDWDDINYKDINTDKVFGGLKLSWTMLNNIQKKAKEME